MSSVEPKAGTLYLLPVWLGEIGDPADMPERNALLAARLRTYFTEHERTARAMLRRLVPAIDLTALQLHRLDKDSTPEEIDTYVDLLRKGEDAAIVSESGMPAIADPGAALVRAAQQAGIRVVPLTGPSSLFLALAASGLNGQHFQFLGYLPRDPRDRRTALQRCDREVQQNGATQMFIETPYRNDALLADILKSCSPVTMLCIATQVTQPDEEIRTRNIAQWRRSTPVIGKRPTVFLLGR